MKPPTTQSEAIRAVKNANTRLKPIGAAGYRIAQQRDIRPPQQERKLMLARLDRELSPEDTAGPALREAVNTFWRELLAGAHTERQMQLAHQVDQAVRQVQSDRWRRLESQHGNVSHCFDRYGQIKKRDRPPRQEEAIEPPLKGCAVVLVGLAGLAAVLGWLVGWRLRSG